MSLENPDKNTEKKPKGVELEPEHWGNISNFAANLLEFQKEMGSEVWGTFNGEVIELNGSNLMNVNEIVSEFNRLKTEKIRRWEEEDREAKEGSK